MLEIYSKYSKGSWDKELRPWSVQGMNNLGGNVKTDGPSGKKQALNRMKRNMKQEASSIGQNRFLA
jgi:hypothetical protein